MPYLPQGVLLCGGAAVAMVERFWGRRSVYAEEFSALVRKDEGGIRTVDLERSARERGWETAAFDGTPEQVRYLLSVRIPVIALIEVSPKRYHYVVLLEWANGKVRFHDPARAPNQQVSEATFLEQWDGGAQWAMTIRPAAATADAAPPAQAAPSEPLPCSPWVDQALDAAAANNLDSAAVLLSTAQRACPDEPVVLREFAAIRFRQRRYDQSVILADAYVRQKSDDRHGWLILATSQYLTGDADDALRSWNRAGEPTVDLTGIDGLRRTRYRVALNAIDIPDRTQLTPRKLAMAQRRLDEIPAFYRSRIEYQPVTGELAEVHAVVAERPLIEPPITLITGNGLSALAREEVNLEIGSLLGAGERWEGSYRWDHAHPRGSVSLGVPLRLGLPGVISVDGIWERYRYQIDESSAEETRRSGGLTFGAWVAPVYRPSLGVRLDRWSEDRNYVAFTQRNDIRLARDRFTVRTELEVGVSRGDQTSYARGYARARWASSPLLQRTSWSIRYGWDLAHVHTPTGLWGFASGDVPYSIPLRAHPYTIRDLLPSATIARTIMHGGVAIDQPLFRTPLATLAIGGFVDWAMMSDRLNSRPSRVFVDGGGGLRIGLADGALGVIRVDLAGAFNDNNKTALTVGLHREWPL